MTTITQILALFVVLGTFLPMVRSDLWWIRGWDFPRMQLMALGLIIAVGGAWLGALDLWVLAVLGVALAVQAAEMRPYSRFARRQVLAGSDGLELSLMISNVLMTNRNDGQLLALVREYEPDLFIALETDAWWTERLRELEVNYPYAIEVPQEDTYGMVLRSRLPLIGPVVEYLVRPNIPSIQTSVALEDGTHIELHAVHPKPPFPDEDTSSTERDGELLIVGKRVKASGQPTVVFGDLNDVAWSRTTRLFQKVSRLLDPRVGRGRYSTYHAGLWWMRWPLDHVFISDHFRLRQLKRLPSIGSDHFPMFVNLSFEPAKQGAQEAPSCDGDDHQEAREKIHEAKKSAAGYVFSEVEFFFQRKIHKPNSANPVVAKTSNP